MGQKIKCEKKCHSIQKRQYNPHCWYCCCHVFLRMRCPKAFHWDLITHKKITRCRLTLKEETTLTRRALRNSYMDGWVIHSLAMSIWVNCNKHYHRHQGLNIIKRLWMFVEKLQSFVISFRCFLRSDGVGVSVGRCRYFNLYLCFVLLSCFCVFARRVHIPIHIPCEIYKFYRSTSEQYVMRAAWNRCNARSTKKKDKDDDGDCRQWRKSILFLF